MGDFERYIKLRDEFVNIVVEHYINLGDTPKLPENIEDIRQNMIRDIDDVIGYIGVDEAILYVEDLIESKDEFLKMSEEIYAGLYDFKELISKDILEVDDIKVGDVLFREDETMTILCKILGFTELLHPIVEFLNVEYHIDLTNKFDTIIYKNNDIMPYPYDEYENDKFI